MTHENTFFFVNLGLISLCAAILFFDARGISKQGYTVGSPASWTLAVLFGGVVAHYFLAIIIVSVYLIRRNKILTRYPEAATELKFPLAARTGWILVAVLTVVYLAAPVIVRNVSDNVANNNGEMTKTPPSDNEQVKRATLSTTSGVDNAVQADSSNQNSVESRDNANEKFKPEESANEFWASTFELLLSIVAVGVSEIGTNNDWTRLDSVSPNGTRWSEPSAGSAYPFSINTVNGGPIGELKVTVEGSRTMILRASAVYEMPDPVWSLADLIDRNQFAKRLCTIDERASFGEIYYQIVPPAQKPLIFKVEWSAGSQGGMESLTVGDVLIPKDCAA
jgi:hypothetical protein